MRDVCRPKYVAFHDCNHYKSRKSSKEVLADSAHWEVYEKDLADQAGWAIFKRRGE